MKSWLAVLLAAALAQAPPAMQASVDGIIAELRP